MHNFFFLHVGLVVLFAISGRQMTSSSKCRYCANALTAFSFRASAPTASALHVAPVAVGYRSIHAQLSAQRNDQSASNNAGSAGNAGTKKRSAWSAKNSKPYVPDGLTDDEYAAIKKREAEQRKNKDFGAFGPRWSRSTRPDGDWMLMRSLWTRGFDSNAPAIDSGNGRNIDGNSSPVGQLSRLLRLRQNAPIFFVSYAIVVAAITCIRLAAQSELIKGGTGAGAGAGASLVLGLRSALVSASRMAANTASFRTQSTIQSLFALCASVLLIRPTNALIEYLNRKLLWSKRRSLGVIAASILSIVFVCAGALAVITF